jgi:hypothetical protein
MIKRLLLPILLLLGASPAFAAVILKKVPPTLSPKHAYVLVELRENKAPPSLGSIVLARYDPAGGDVRGGARSPATALPAGHDVRITVDRRPLAKTKIGRLYLIEMEPDTWVVEGAIDLLKSNTAFSLGSRSFVLESGTVTDLGVISTRPDWREGESGDDYNLKMVASAFLGPFAKQDDPTPWMAELRERGAGDIPLPAALAARAKPVRFTGDARFGNYLGGIVNRIDGRKGRPAPAAVDGGAGPTPAPDAGAAK